MSCAGNGTVLLVIFLSKPITQINHEEGLRQIATERQSTRYLTNILQSCQDISKKENLKNSYSKEEPKEI